MKNINEIAVRAGLIFAEADTMGRKELRYEEKRFAEEILVDIDKIIDEMYQTYPLNQAVLLIDLAEKITYHFRNTDEDQITK